MAVQSASAEWNGSLKEGSGKMRAGSGAFEGPFTFVSRFETGPGTNPEELIGAGHNPTSIKTTSKVHLGSTAAGPTITQIDLNVEGQVPGIDAAQFQEFAEGAKQGCVVSRALAGVSTITLTATLR
jgi:osmotically inducible protein OsmC